MLSDMDKPYGLVALPNGCAEGKKFDDYVKSFVLKLRFDEINSMTATFIYFILVESACQNGQGFRGNDCQQDQMCLPDGMGSYLCLCGDDDRNCNS